MDGHIRWLRRLVMSRVARRLIIEAAMAACAVFCACFIAELELTTSAVLVVVTAQAVPLMRIAVAVLANPVNHRYLMGWEDPSIQLQPEPDTGQRNRAVDTLLAGSGFQFAVRLVEPRTQQGVDVYRPRTNFAVISTLDRGEPFVVLSRLSDGRLLVTAADLVPPLSGVVVNLEGGAELPRLVDSHLARLRMLRERGLGVVATDHRSAMAQLRLEWQAWNQLGPFIGPFLAVDHRRRPLTLQVRVDQEQLWHRTAVADPPAMAIETSPAAEQEPEPEAKQEQGLQPEPEAKQEHRPIAAISAAPVAPGPITDQGPPAWTTVRRPKRTRSSEPVSSVPQSARAGGAPRSEPNPGTPVDPGPTS